MLIAVTPRSPRALRETLSTSDDDLWALEEVLSEAKVSALVPLEGLRPSAKNRTAISRSRSEHLIR